MKLRFHTDRYGTSLFFLAILIFTITSITLQAEDQNELFYVDRHKVKSYKQVKMNMLLKARVIHVLDGDTVEVIIDNPPQKIKSNETLRLIGIDAPELQKKEYYAEESLHYAEKSLSNREVWLAFDRTLRDKYKRLLCYLYTGNGDCFNAAAIREGYAYAYVWFSFQFIKEFVLLEYRAKEEKTGLWMAEEE
ncbi:MAG: thermonuclease family protein [Spirochaetales bacterium]|nr:thermonuclease family protein [Spirochaetales bacterium]